MIAIVVGAVGVAAAWTFGVSYRGEPGYNAAFGTPAGDTVTALVTRAGPPDREVSAPNQECTKVGGTRELIYELRMMTLGGWGGDDVVALVAVCAAADGKILNTLHVQF